MRQSAAPPKPVFRAGWVGSRLAIGKESRSATASVGRWLELPTQSRKSGAPTSALRRHLPFSFGRCSKPSPTGVRKKSTDECNRPAHQSKLGRCLKTEFWSPRKLQFSGSPTAQSSAVFLSSLCAGTRFGCSLRSIGIATMRLGSLRIAAACGPPGARRLRLRSAPNTREPP